METTPIHAWSLGPRRLVANAALPAGDATIRIMTPLEEQIVRFTTHLRDERRRSPRTVEDYGRDLGSFARFLEARGLEQDAAKVDVAVLRGFLGSIVRELEPATMARKMSVLRSFFRYLERRGIVRTNPAAALRPPKIVRSAPRFLTVEETLGVVAAPSEDAGRDETLALRDRAMLELLYASGMRVSELASLSLGDLDLRSREGRVIGKGDKQRRIYFGEVAERAIAAWLAARPRCVGKDGDQDERALFLGRFGTRLTARQIENVVRRYGALGAARPDLHPHAIRHSAATHLLDAGADLRGIQELLGHASLSTTQRYTHVGLDRLTEAYVKAHPLGRARDD